MNYYIIALFLVYFVMTASRKTMYFIYMQSLLRNKVNDRTDIMMINYCKQLTR